MLEGEILNKGICSSSSKYDTHL